MVVMHAMAVHLQGSDLGIEISTAIGADLAARSRPISCKAIGARVRRVRTGWDDVSVQPPSGQPWNASISETIRRWLGNDPASSFSPCGRRWPAQRVG